MWQKHSFYIEPMNPGKECNINNALYQWELKAHTASTQISQITAWFAPMAMFQQRLKRLRQDLRVLCVHDTIESILHKIAVVY